MMLTMEEAAKMLRVTVRTLSTWIRSGRISVARPGRRVLVPRSEVERLLSTSRAV
jgi:excisionase family DNA binding protein